MSDSKKTETEVKAKPAEKLDPATDLLMQSYRQFWVCWHKLLKPCVTKREIKTLMDKIKLVVGEEAINKMESTWR